LPGRSIEELMADFGAVSRNLANHPQLRWLGPHKGAVHLALASITNACFDLWAKTRGVPLWKLLLDLRPAELIQTLDLSSLEEVLSPAGALELLQGHLPNRSEREHILKSGYPGYDTSVGWFGYEDERVRENARKALDRGFRAFKLKVGSPQQQRDVRRAYMLRDLVGSDSLVMLDVNQQWSFHQALQTARALKDMDPYWIEEPIHPDDISGHAKLAQEIVPIRVALGEHVPNRVMFKNFIEARALHFVQVDCTRVAGVSEFLTVSLMARKFGLTVVPHVGDMGQIHQHLVLFNHIAMGLPALFLEYIPHVREHFVYPARVEGGMYETPQKPGCSCDLVELRGR
jgi:L-fuconate dehydratase